MDFYSQYDRTLEGALRRVRREFAYITEDYPFDLPAELTWVLVKALVAEQGLSVEAAARVVLEFCERRGNYIPALLNSAEPGEEDGLLTVWH